MVRFLALSTVAVLALAVITGTVHAAPRPLSAPLHVSHHPRHADTMMATPPDEPVEGDIWPVAIYWSFVDVGTPPVKFPVALDSGSYTLDIPKAGCQGCVSTAPNAAYDPSKSTTSQGPAQPFSNSYETCDLKDPTAVCTIAGHWWTDSVSLAGSASVNVSFGAIETQTSNFDQFKHIDGVMGLAGPDGDANVFGSLVQAGALPANVWAMCMHHGSVSNGTVTWGGTDSRLYLQDIHYVDDVGGGQFYAIDTPGMTIDFANGTSADIQQLEQSSILDTGTNVLLLPTAAFDSVMDIMLSSCSGPGPALHGVCDASGQDFLQGTKCIPFTQDQINAFPGVGITLNAHVTLRMTGQDYILRHPTDDGLYCFGIRPSSSGGYQIIGDTTMRNYYMVMDRGNQQIGWAKVNTDTCGSLSA